MRPTHHKHTKPSCLTTPLRIANLCCRQPSCASSGGFAAPSQQARPSPQNRAALHLLGFGLPGASCAPQGGRPEEGAFGLSARPDPKRSGLVTAGRPKLPRCGASPAKGRRASGAALSPARLPQDGGARAVRAPASRGQGPRRRSGGREGRRAEAGRASGRSSASGAPGGRAEADARESPGGTAPARPPACLPFRRARGRPAPLSSGRGAGATRRALGCGRDAPLRARPLARAVHGPAMEVVDETEALQRFFEGRRAGGRTLRGGSRWGRARRGLRVALGRGPRAQPGRQARTRPGGFCRAASLLQAALEGSLLL